MKKLIVQEIQIDDIVKQDTKRYNSNNHWKDNKKPEDYQRVIDASNCKHWIHKFRDDIKQFTISDPSHIRWMIGASKISSQTGQFTQLYQDEMIQFLKDYSHIQNSFFNDSSQYFVRTENVSLKYGQHGIGPYNSLKMIVESLVSCIEGHKPIYSDTKELVVYLLPFIHMEPHNEYRVFVYKNNITAISQQDVYSVFDALTSKVVEKHYNLISTYFFKHIRKLIINRQNYTYDFVILPGGVPYFIEMNSFGPEYAAGSALYHWLLDYDILHSDSSALQVYFRYVIR
jgi:hypothetical protein